MTNKDRFEIFVFKKRDFQNSLKKILRILKVLERKWDFFLIF